MWPPDRHPSDRHPPDMYPPDRHFEPLQMLRVISLLAQWEDQGKGKDQVFHCQSPKFLDEPFYGARWNQDAPMVL